MCVGVKVTYRQTRGFTLIEVLVSMVILAVGLLGLASLQGFALKDSQDAYYYRQATLLNYEMADRIKANHDYWGIQIDGTLKSMPIPSEGNRCDSIDSACTDAEIAAYDLFYWEQNAKKILPLSPTGTPVAQIQRCVNVDEKETNPVTLCLLMTWARMNQRASVVRLSSTMSYLLKVTP